MKRILFFLVTIASFSLLISISNKVSAAPFIDFPEYHVLIDINEDSSVIVTETITNRFNGLSHGLRRDVTLKNPSLSTYCEQNPDSTCGGFDELFIIGAIDENGKKLTEKDGFRTYNLTTEAGEEYVRFEWEKWPEGQYQNNTEVTWSIQYKLWGSIQWRNPGGISSSSKGEDVAYLYWNALPEERSGNIENSSVSIRFPESVEISTDNFAAYTYYYFTPKLNSADNEIELTLNQNLSSYGDFTVGYEFKEGELTRPASIDYKVSGPFFYVDVLVDGIKVRTSPDSSISGVPAGTHSFKVSTTGFKDEQTTLDLKEGETEVLEIKMQRTAFFQFLYYLSLLSMLLGCAITPLGFMLMWLKYRSKGIDKNMPKTIIPLFNPPKDVSPYLLGSIKDEKVEKEDVIGSIIDLAYRGYIKIEEVKKGKDYKMFKLDGNKDDTGLNDIEKEILDAVFNGKEEMSTKNMRTHFPLKYTKLVNKIYDEMVSMQYFSSSPRTIRSAYFGGGAFLSIFSLAATIIASIVLSFLVNFPVVFTFGGFLILYGISMIAFANYMPAKTQKGSKTYADILGFRMYLNTAERFRLQKLGPEEFERFLSYAIVFKIEKEWAKKFEGIYEGVPDWYEGSSGSLYDAVFISTFARSFATAATVASTPVSSSSSSHGGGWSGGGSFGGFSGGGGGGGSAGGW